MEPEAIQTIVDAIIQSTKPDWTWYIYVLNNVVLALIAVLALVYARKQFGKSSEQAETAKAQAEAAKATAEAAIAQAEAAKEQAQAAIESIRHDKLTSLFGLDRGFQTEQLATAREHLHNLRKEIETDIKNTHGHLTENAKLKAIREEFSVRLHNMLQNDEKKYLSILKVAEFFETVGLMVEREWVSLDDIVELYGGGILRLDDAFDVHFQKEAEDLSMPEGYFEYFSSLVKKTRELMNIPAP